MIVLGITLVVAGCRGNPAEDPQSTVPVSTTSPSSTTSVTQAPPGAPTTSTSTTTLLEPAFAEGAMFLWDTAWQIAAKADAEAMTEYVDRLAAARGRGGQSITGFWFSMVNSNQDINTPNGFGNGFGSFADPNPAYLDDVESLISLAHQRGLRVAIVVAWDGPARFSVEQGLLTVEMAHGYGSLLAARLTRSEFAGRDSIAAWVMGGDPTGDCCGGEHGDVWEEVVRGIQEAEATNGFPGAPILFHTAPGGHLNYVGADWIDGHAPQTGHCSDAVAATAALNELVAAEARSAPVWGNGEMRYEEINWECNGFQPITPDQVLADAKAMADLGFMRNFVYGFDPRWDSERPGSVGMSAEGVSAGLQMILDEPGLIQTRPPLP